MEGEDGKLLLKFDPMPDRLNQVTQNEMDSGVIKMF